MTTPLDPRRPGRVLQPITRPGPGLDDAGLFDEADDLHAARTDVRDAHDRYAGLETTPDD